MKNNESLKKKHALISKFKESKIKQGSNTFIKKGNCLFDDLELTTHPEAMKWYDDKCLGGSYD